LKVVTYNIQFGLGVDGRYDLSRIAAEVRDADIIALQEVDRHWQRSGCIDSPAVLASHLPEHQWVYGANLDMDASYRDATNRLVNRRRQFGTMILSRLPIVSSRNHLLPKYATLTQHSIQQGALEVVIVTLRAGPVRFYSTHLSHLSQATRLPQVEALLQIHARAE
jgi:endonuclease/exonuclease/phosphatase family metal-dependent hydrolase